LNDAIFIERDRFGDRRRDQQQLLQLEPKVRREPLGRDIAALGRAFEHVVNLLDEMFDLEGGAGGDLLLQARQLLAAFLIAKIDFNQSAGDQTAADEHHGDQKIIAHQPPPPRRAEVSEEGEITKGYFPATHEPLGYLITLSARPTAGRRSIAEAPLARGTTRPFVARKPASLPPWPSKRGDLPR
jgi:hypothetical protein